jgi:hypothetical protein
MQFIKWSYLPNWIGGSNRPGVIPPTPQRLSAPPNIPEEHRPSDILPKGGSPWDGRSAPGVLNTFVVFFLFFHLALRFWNHTCERILKPYLWKNFETIPAKEFWNHTCERILKPYLRKNRIGSVIPFHTKQNLLPLQCTVPRKAQIVLRTDRYFFLYIYHKSLIQSKVTFF